MPERDGRPGTVCMRDKGRVAKHRDIRERILLQVRRFLGDCGSEAARNPGAEA